MTAGGVAYAVTIPLSVAESLPRPGGTVELHTALVVREDSWTLYGFGNATDRGLFQRLMGTTGVGPALAMNLMSALGGDLPNYEEALRALYAKDKKKFQSLVREWPSDIRDHAKGLAEEAWG